MCEVKLSLYKKRGVKKVEEREGQKLNVKSVSKSFVAELKGVFCISSIRVGVLFIFLDIFWIFNSINLKIVIISKVIIISANVNLCALEMKIDGINFWMFAYCVSIKTWFSKIDNGMSSFCWRRNSTFLSKWGSWIEVLHKNGEIIAKEVVDLPTGIELSIIFKWFWRCPSELAER